MNTICLMGDDGNDNLHMSDAEAVSGVIASVDIPKLVQCKPGDKLHFRRISVEEAQRLYLEEQKEFDRFRKQIHAPCKEVLDCRPTAKRLETLFG